MSMADMPIEHQRAYYRAYRAKNAAKIKARQKRLLAEGYYARFYLRHREDIKAKSARWRKQNPGKSKKMLNKYNQWKKEQRRNATEWYARLLVANELRIPASKIPSDLALAVSEQIKLKRLLREQNYKT